MATTRNVLALPHFTQTRVGVGFGFVDVFVSGRYLKLTFTNDERPRGPAFNAH